MFSEISPRIPLKNYFEIPFESSPSKTKMHQFLSQFLQEFLKTIFQRIFSESIRNSICHEILKKTLPEIIRKFSSGTALKKIFSTKLLLNFNYGFKSICMPMKNLPWVSFSEGLHRIFSEILPKRLP